MLRKPYSAAAGLLGAALLIFFVVRFIAANHRLNAAMASSTAASAEPTMQSAPQKPTPPLRISAAQLYSEFDQNAVAANDEFAGRRLEVSGKVLSVDKEARGLLRLRIGVDQYGLHDIAADLPDASEATIAQLKKGHSVTLLCTDVHRALGSVTLDKCSIDRID